MDDKTNGLCKLVRQYAREFAEENQEYYDKRNFALARRIYLRFKMEGVNPNHLEKIHKDGQYA